MSKTYDEIFDAARSAYGTGAYDDATLEFLFPELLESEDERTRKAIINYILYKADGVSEEDEHKWISWLEKLKEKDRKIPERELTDFEIEVHEIIAQARCDKRLADEAVLKQFEQEAACALMLKVEKQKEQKPAEWSMEDEKMYNVVIVALALKEAQGYLSSWGKTFEDVDNWLKSLRPQPHWKPYEYQIQMLLSVINDPNNAASASAHLALKSLYNDLKKL